MLITPDKLRGVYRTRLASSSHTGQQLDCILIIEDDGCWYVRFEVRASHSFSFVMKDTLGAAVREFNCGHVEPLDKNV